MVKTGAPKATVELLHTPAPWKRDGLTVYALTENLSDSVSLRKLVPLVNRFSAQVQRGGHTEGAGQVELEANAALIEKAPDLLAALMQIAAWDDRQGNDTLARTGSYAIFDEPNSVRIARQALKGLLK